MKKDDRSRRGHAGGGGDADRLSLFDACAMAVGGMVGGGIFAVLGTAALQAGNAAYLAFGLAGLLALVTGLSYARLTVDFDEPGGSFSYVEHLVGPRAAGTVSRFLLLGYLFTISLYAVTFGAYTARLLGFAESAAPSLGAGVILALAGLNLVAVRESGAAEDVLVVGRWPSWPWSPPSVSWPWTRGRRSRCWRPGPAGPWPRQRWSSWPTRGFSS